MRHKALTYTERFEQSGGSRRVAQMIREAIRAGTHSDGVSPPESEPTLEKIKLPLGPPAPSYAKCHCGRSAALRCQCGACFCVPHWWKHSHTNKRMEQQP